MIHWNISCSMRFKLRRNEWRKHKISNLFISIFLSANPSPDANFSTIAKESSTSVEMNCSLQLGPANLSGSSNSISDADAINERVGLGNVFKQFFKCVLKSGSVGTRFLISIIPEVFLLNLIFLPGFFP